MFSTIVKRLLQGILVVFLVMVVTFFLVRMIPGDPARGMAGNVDKAVIESIHEEMGLNYSIPVQLWRYLKTLAKGDLGYSFFCKDSVVNVIKSSYRPTLILIGMALPTAIILGLVFGIIAAKFSGTFIDKLISAVAVLIQSMPIYWVLIILIQILSVKLRILPASGYTSWKNAVLPAIVLALPLTGVFTRNVRVNMLGSMQAEFSKAAKARGIKGFAILIKYSFRNILVPFLTLVGSQLGFVFGNCLLIENIYGYPGIALQCLNAILRRDYFLIQGLVCLLSGIFILLNTAIDISYLYLDPRIRKAQGGL